MKVQIWESILSIPLIIQLFGIGYFVSVEPLRPHGEAGSWWVFLLVEAIFLVDFVVHWLIVPKNMVKPTLKKTAIYYLKQ